MVVTILSLFVCEIHEHECIPFYMTIICTLSILLDVIVKYRGKIRALEAEIKQILKQEEEEKQLRLTEMEINKASNLIEHRDEIMSRPARTWIKTTSKKRAAPSDSEEGAEERGDLTAGMPSKKAKREEIKKGLAKKRNNADSVSYVAACGEAGYNTVCSACFVRIKKMELFPVYLALELFFAKKSFRFLVCMCTCACTCTCMQHIWTVMHIEY